MLKKNPGVVTNLSYATIKDAVSKNSDWVTTMRTQFPTVPVATPKIWQGTGHTITASGSGVRPYEVGPGSINITGPVRGTGIPESAVPSGQKPGGSSMLDNVGNFLGEVFKKRPDMVGSSVPGGTGIPKDIKFKPTPTVGVKPATNPFAKAPKPPKPTNPMGKV
jgi:hypothetical protein